MTRGVSIVMQQALLTRKVHLAFVIVASLLIGGSVFLAADAYAMSLYKQIQNRVEGQTLYCNNPDHLLVLRASMKLACVYPETADKKSWQPAVIDDNGNVTVSGSTSIRAHEEDHRIAYTVIEGGLVGAWHDDYLNSIFLKVSSRGDGGMELSVPKQLFEEQCSFFMVLENGDEVAFSNLQDEHNCLLQFNFTRPSPLVEIFQAVPINELDPPK